MIKRKNFVTSTVTPFDTQKSCVAFRIKWAKGEIDLIKTSRLCFSLFDKRGMVVEDR